MKKVDDKKAKSRHFEKGEEVPLVLPCRKQPLQAKFEGPYKVLKKVNHLNYVISTLDHRKKKRMVHINWMKHSEGKKKTEELCVKEDNFVIKDVEGKDRDFVIKDKVKLKNSDI